MSDPSLRQAMREYKIARIKLKAAREILESELPEELQVDLHYNGRRAQVPLEYVDAVKLLRGEGP